MDVRPTPTHADHIREAKRKMALSDWHLRLRIEEADAVRAEFEQLERSNAELAKALRQIEAWDSFPRVPDSNLFGATISYAAAYGSNGERDFMRAVACTALRNAGVSHELSDTDI